MDSHWHSLIVVAKDFATQVHWWRDYGKACRQARVVKGQFATPQIGEWLSGQTGFGEIESVAGLPQGWTSPEPGAVSSLDDLPWLVEHQPAAWKVVSLFSGCLGLELGLRPYGPQTHVTSAPIQGT